MSGALAARAPAAAARNGDRGHRARDRRLSVVVPTVRAEVLERCLDAVATQTRAVDEVVVVRPADDARADAVVARFGDPRITTAVVSRRGFAHALIAGASRATGDVIAFTDDDAVPRPDWAERMMTHFDVAGVGAVGGRDRLPEGSDATSPAGRLRAARTGTVGMVGRWGKLVGNHHLGAGEAREVMVLKGVNMAFRRSALALPRGLEGERTQPHTEVAISLWARRRGWRIVYDPELLVDHYPAALPEAVSRTRPDPATVRARAYNLVAGMLTMCPELYARRAAYGLLVGDGECVGVARALAGLARRDTEPLRRLGPSLLGQASALRDLRRGRGVEMVALG